MEELVYLIGDGNGLFLSMSGETTQEPSEGKIFEKIGDAMRACVEYNKNNESTKFRVLSCAPYYV